MTDAVLPSAPPDIAPRLHRVDDIELDVLQIAASRPGLVLDDALAQFTSRMAALRALQAAAPGK